MMKYSIYRSISVQECTRILNVKAGFTQNELRKAYLDRVKQSHPDMKGGDSQEFRKIAEAYYILKNSQVKLQQSPEVSYDWTQPKQQFRYQNASNFNSTDFTQQTEKPFHQSDKSYKSKDAYTIGLFGFGLVLFAIWSYTLGSSRSGIVAEIEESYKKDNFKLEDEFIINKECFRRKIFVGGLAAHTTQESMREHFSQYGPVQDAILMVDRNTRRSRCFGFVTMRDPESVDAILAEDQIVEGKKVDCKPAVPRDHAPAMPSDTLTQYRTKKMFVGGLPPDVTEEAFRNFFSQFGAIEDSVIMFDRETGRPRGFGFITFMSEDAVERVLQNYDSNFINGKWVECKKATPKDIGMMDRAKSSFQPFNTMQPYMMYPFYSQNPYETPYQPTYEQFPPEEQQMTYKPPPPESLRERNDEELRNNLLEDLLGEDTEETYSHPHRTVGIEHGRGRTFI